MVHTLVKHLYPRRMLKIGCKPCATIGSMHGGINRRDAGYEWQPNILRHARAGCQKSGANHVQLLVHAWRLSIAGKPVPVAVINHLHLHIHSYPGMARGGSGHKPGNCACVIRRSGPREYPGFIQRQHQHKIIHHWGLPQSACFCGGHK